VTTTTTISVIIATSKVIIISTMVTMTVGYTAGRWPWPLKWPGAVVGH
jgi:hypothetical protein